MIPERIREVIRAYVADGIPPGGFTMAVLANDLVEAVIRADPPNLLHLHAIVLHVLDMVPATMRGSWAKVGDRIAQRML